MLKLLTPKDVHTAFKGQTELTEILNRIICFYENTYPKQEEYLFIRCYFEHLQVFILIVYSPFKDSEPFKNSIENIIDKRFMEGLLPETLIRVPREPQQTLEEYLNNLERVENDALISIAEEYQR